MKDLVFIIAVKKDGQLKKEYEYSIKSWNYWCKKNDVELFLMEEPVTDMNDMHIIWQRYFLFDMLDHNEIEYNQILMVDADTIIHPDCPNFFNETDDKYCLIHDDGSYDWILRGMEHYEKYVFNDEWFDFWEYGNSGFQIVNKHDIDINLMSYKYNMTCMPKKEILGDDHLYTKLGWIYHFNGIPDKNVNVPLLMEKSYNYLYGNLDD